MAAFGYKVKRRWYARRKKGQHDPHSEHYQPGLEEVEFMMALSAWKTDTGNHFPTCCDLLEVLRGLGWRRMPDLDGADRGQAGQD